MFVYVVYRGVGETEAEMFLEIKDLKKSFGNDSNRVQVLKGISFSIEKGEICVLLGPSGS